MTPKPLHGASNNTLSKVLSAFILTPSRFVITTLLQWHLLKFDYNDAILDAV